MSGIQTLKSWVQPLAPLLPDAWVAEINETATGTTTELADPSSYTIANISHDDVTGVAQAAGGQLSLTFEYVDPRLVATPFTFDLIDNMDGAVTSISASLDPLAWNVEPSSASLPVGIR